MQVLPVVTYKLKARGKRSLTIEAIRLKPRGGIPSGLTYWLRDYGMLPYFFTPHVGLMNEGVYDYYPRFQEIGNVYIVDRALHAMIRRGRRSELKWGDWHLGRLTEIGATELCPGRPKRYIVGPFGMYAYRASEMIEDRENWLTSFENLLVLRLLSESIRRIGQLFNQFYKAGKIRIECEGPEKISHLLPPFEVDWHGIGTNLYDAYLLHVEEQATFPTYKGPSNLLVLSGIIFNEICLCITNLRREIVNYVLPVAEKYGYEMTYKALINRGITELSRGFRRLNMIGSRGPMWYINIPDNTLATLVSYSLEKSKNLDKGRTYITLEEFTDCVKADFRLLIHPADCMDFLSRSVDYTNLGLHLEVIEDYLKQNFERFLHRLVDLGLASIRADGDVRVEIV